MPVACLVLGKEKGGKPTMEHVSVTLEGEISCNAWALLVYVMVIIMILSFWTDKSGLGKQWRPRLDCSWSSSLNRVCILCHSISTSWMQFSMVNLKPYCSIFRILITSFSGVWNFRNFMVHVHVFQGKEKLGIPTTEHVSIALEDDGTEVDEEDYFTFLPFNTTLMILRDGENWQPPGSGKLTHICLMDSLLIGCPFPILGVFCF